MTAVDQASALARSRALVDEYDERDLVAEVEAVFEDAGDDLAVVVETALETFRLRRHALSGALGRRPRRRLVVVEVGDLAATVLAAGARLDCETRRRVVERLAVRAPDLAAMVSGGNLVGGLPPGAPRIAVGDGESPTFSARAHRPETANRAPGNSGAAGGRSRKVRQR